ncbi:MAG: leucine-rich repeat protein, partial [Methanomassiliicoccaceae archaeon]|nr:leucine-rich repeat protein [Methanomassiliicoccaceae archaeon]
TEVVLPAGLETIGGYAFYECTDLTEVVLPAGTQLETIGGYAFYGCTALRLMTIPVGVTSVGSYAFYECGSLEGTISLDSAAIGQRAFWNCVSLYYLDMRAGTIDNYAFRGCTELVSVILGPDVTSVGQSAFSQCTSIEFLWLGPNMTTMGVLAFSNLNLQTIIFECDASLSTIAANAISRGTMYVPFDYSKDLSKFSSKLTVERFIVTDEGNLLLISGSGFEKEIGDCTDGPQLIFRVTDPDYDKDSLRVLVSGASFELIDEGSGNYVLNITEEKESIMSVTVSVEYFICTVSSTGDFFTLAEISGSKRYSSTYSFEIIVGPMYDASGMTVTANGSPIVPYYDNRYSITLTGDTVISVTGIVPVSSFEVTFDNGVSVFPVTVTAGTPVPDSTIPAFGPDNGVAFDGWYTDADMINRFDIGSPITSDMTLYGGWTADRYTVTMSTAHGTIIAYSPTGTEIVSGMSVPAGTVLKLKAVMNYGYEVIYWNVNGKVMYGSDTFVISLNGDTDVTVGLRYYSTGYSYTVDTETILPDDYEKYWFWGQEIDPLAGDLTSYYTAMPRGSLIVGDYLYLRSYFTFYKVSIYDGTLFGKMEVTDLTTGFQYANGLFMTTGKAYDLDLNYVADVPNGIRYLIYTDGAYYGFGDTTAVKFTVDREAGTSQVEWTVSYSRYVPDDYGGLAYGDGYFFIIEASASSPDRKITSFSMATGAKIDTITLDKVAGHLLDDGWLTYYDGYVYLTTYTSGLFGSTNPIKGSIVKVELLPDGKFDRNTVSYTSTGTEKHSSGFIVYNGRGYVNANDELQVYNVDTMELIYSVKGQYTHGGMVLNTGYATAENDYTVYLYVIPYAASSEIVVFEDKQGQTEGIMMTLESAGVGQYATTAIRSGQNGELVWYNDSSVLFIYGKHIEEKEYNFFVNDGTTAGWITLTGPTPGEALLKMYGMSVSSVSGNVTYNGTLMNVAYLANVNFAGTAYEGWNVPTDGILDEAHQYHRYWMISVTDVNDGWYSAADGRTYSEIDSIGTSAFGMPFVSVGGPYTPAPLTFVNDGYDLPAGTAGVAIDGVTVYGGVSGGKLPYAFAASGLPEGLLIDAYSGTIYGTPISFSTAGKATILVTDGMGTIAYITISFGEIEPIAYTLSEGGTVGWTKGAPNGLTVTSNGELSKFIGVKVDNVLIGASDYDVTEGSTVVTFKPSYLSTLSNGNHVVELIFSDGSAFTSLSVSAASTGDGNGNGNGNGNGDGGNGNGSGNVNGNGSANANVSATDEGAVAIAAAVAILALAALAIFVLIRRP